MKSNSKPKIKQLLDGDKKSVLLPPQQHQQAHQSENAQALKHKEALKAVQDALSRRELSELELKNKLSDKHSEEALTYALEHAKAKRWLRSEEEIAEDALQMFEGKLKSNAYIKQQMEKRGLPTKDLDFSKEQDKINELIQKRFSHVDMENTKERMKVVRFLLNRGFELRSIQSVIKNVEVDYYEEP